MKLIIIESPNKAKTIQKYLGSEYKVLASGGHVCDLPEKSLGIDVEHDFAPEYIINKDKKDSIKNMRNAVNSAKEVYLATDPDREGEAISWHLAKVLDIEGKKNRIEFNEISKKAVMNALENPREINIQLVDAQQARRVLDRLVGYKISPIINKKIKKGLSAGRVQSAALKMIVDKEVEIRNFVPEEYWNIFGYFVKEGTDITFRAQFIDWNGKKIKVNNEKSATNVAKEMEICTYSVDKVTKGTKKVHPQPPFTTSTLQQDGATKLGLTAPQVMQVAQQLYEGIEIPGEGHVALVTYIRTDSVRLSPESQQAAIKYIVDHYGPKYAPQQPNVYKTKSANVQDAHEAIRPITLDRTPDSIKDKVSRNQYRLYKLIYERFLASQMTNAVYDTLNVHIAGQSEKGILGFQLTGKTKTFAGYTAIYEIAEENDEKEESQQKLPPINEGDNLKFTGAKTEQKFTKAPSRYTDASLVKAMEDNGIGRPSTYASVIAVLAKREYTEKEQKAIKPTPLGESVTQFMTKYFDDIVDTKFTARMESQLDTIEEGKTRWQDLVASFYPPLEKHCKVAVKDGEKMTVPAEPTGIVCDKCGAPMVLREGKFGKFYGCSNYPKCKNIINAENEVVGKCPDCGSDIIKRKSKKGKVFYGCSNYPTCKFMSWEVPAPSRCPKCNSVMRVVTKKDKTEYVCTNATCNHKIDVENQVEPLEPNQK